MQEKIGGGLTAAVDQERSLLHVSTGARSQTQKVPSDVKPERIYFVTGEFRGTW